MPLSASILIDFFSKWFIITIEILHFWFGIYEILTDISRYKRYLYSFFSHAAAVLTVIVFYNDENVLFLFVKAPEKSAFKQTWVFSMGITVFPQQLRDFFIVANDLSALWNVSAATASLRVPGVDSDDETKTPSPSPHHGRSRPPSLIADSSSESDEGDARGEVSYRKDQHLRPKLSLHL